MSDGSSIQSVSIRVRPWFKNKKPRDSGERGAGKNATRRRRLLREKNLRGVRLGAGSGVLVHDAGLHGLVHRGNVGDGGGLAARGILGRDGGIELLVERLEARLHALVAGLEAGGFTRGLDGRFGVG